MVFFPTWNSPVANLPESASEPGRAHKAAAEGLLARVQLTLGKLGGGRKTRPPM